MPLAEVYVKLKEDMTHVKLIVKFKNRYSVENNSYL